MRTELLSSQFRFDLNFRLAILLLFLNPISGWISRYLDFCFTLRNICWLFGDCVWCTVRIRAFAAHALVTLMVLSSTIRAITILLLIIRKDVASIVYTLFSYYTETLALNESALSWSP